MSYNISIEQAMRNAAAIMQEGRANAVKLEGGEEDCCTSKSHC